MKRFIRFSLVGVAAVLLASCGHKKPHIIDPELTRTVLVYMAADNTLSSYGMPNIDSMVSGAKGKAIAGQNLLVYFDPTNDVPKLYKISAQGKELVKTYPEQNSGSATTLRSVIDEVEKSYPSPSYGLVLWSHGSGWAPNALVMSAKSLRTSSEEPWWFGVPEEARQGPPTKSFGQDGSSWIELSDLIGAMHDHEFDFIMFDACYMGQVEVTYGLRNKADYLIVTPTETLADGFPYEKITPCLFGDELDLQTLCLRYYDFYKKHPNGGDWRSATVSMIRTSEMDALAARFKTLVAGKDEQIAGFNLSGIQRFDRYNKHTMFDLGAFATQVGDASPLAAFEAQLEKAVIFKRNTDAFIYGAGGFRITDYSGLSTYIPVSSYPDLNTYYQQTDWYKATH